MTYFREKLDIETAPDHSALFARKRMADLEATP